tara:strand:- start:356 stop:568 length:213 start_codon:yes stop_codon:yes gene_type:complete
MPNHLKKAERYRRKLSNLLTKYYESELSGGQSSGQLINNLTAGEKQALLHTNQKRNYDILAQAFTMKVDN